VPKYSFADVSASVLERPKKVAGPHYKRRVEFYKRYFPPSVARVMALRWNITKDSAHYSPGIMKGLKKLEGRIRDAMRINRVGRDRAAQIVWRAIAEDYRRSNVKIESSYDLFRNWIEDNVSPGEGDETVS
jgi:hypothetical protein